MSKLTREDWIKFNGEYSWEAIELHTAECVAEAVAEVKKTHFEIGERVQVEWPGGIWEETEIIPRSHSLLSFRYPKARRPPCTRPMTDDELEASVRNSAVWPQKYSRPTLEAMAKDLGIETRVEV